MSQSKLQRGKALASLTALGAFIQLNTSPGSALGTKQYKTTPSNIVELFASAQAHGKDGA
jgi:hypothetical protein